MADVIDEGNQTAELFLEAALTRRQPEAPQSVGFCLNCGEPTPYGHRWCDKDCRDDWAKRG